MYFSKPRSPRYSATSRCKRRLVDLKATHGVFLL
jgi:hypothetical protein